MVRKLLINEFKKNTARNGILLLFITLSMSVAVSVTLLLTQLFTSISSMYETAKPPHFLQLHKGEFSKEELDKFHRSFGGINHAQTVTMLNINGKDIVISDSGKKNFSLEECRLDISFVKQNEEYDVLLGKKREILKLKKGEIAVPVILEKSFDLAEGDILTLTDGENMWTYRIKTFAYDGQMNSTLASSTRFLVSDEDYYDLLGGAFEKEYMIEVWFFDRELAATYQSAYEESSLGLPKNGQAVTYPVIFLLSALTDLFVAVIFSFTGILLVVISLICLRYIILAELEEDKKEIGTMKAIGISGKGIRSLYLMKIRIIALTGSVLGTGIAWGVSYFISRHLSRIFGEQEFNKRSILFVILIPLFLYGILLFFTKKLLKKIYDAKIIDLLITEKGFEKKERRVHPLRKSKMLSFDILVSLHKIKKGCGMVFSLMLLVSFFIILPFRTVQTMENKEFVKNMGSPVYDLLIEVEQGEKLEERNQKAEQLLKEGLKKGRWKQVDVFRTVRLQGMSSIGEILGMYISSGLTAGRGLHYLEGTFPKKENEIALSYLSAEELRKSVGEPLEIIGNNKRESFVITGIYQDITSGGKTAKTIHPFSDVSSEKYSYGILLENKKISESIKELRDELKSGYSVEDMNEFLSQTLGNVNTQIKKAGIMVLLIGLCISSLIVSLFLKLLITREAPFLALKKTLGIPLSSIKKQELYPVLIAGGIGSFLGGCLGEFSGDLMMSAFLSALRMGLKEFAFIGVSVGSLVLLPFLLTSVLGLVGIVLLKQVKNINVMQFVNE